MAGTLALALHTSGVLGRLFAEAMENIPTGPGDALRTQGVGPRDRTTAGAIGGEFKLPALAAGVDAKLESRFYDELDIVPATGATVAVHRAFWTTAHIAEAVALGVLGIGAGYWIARRRRPAAAASASSWAPARITPLGVVTSLRRLEQELPQEKASALRAEISELELKYFGPNAAETSDSELQRVVDKWQRA
jgi:hypothetical protein